MKLNPDAQMFQPPKRDTDMRDITIKVLGIEKGSQNEQLVVVMTNAFFVAGQQSALKLFELMLDGKITKDDVLKMLTK